MKQLFGETAIYGLSSMSTKLISLFLIPLYTAVLSPADYGTLNLLNAFFSLALLLAVFALDNSAARWFYDSEELTDKKSTISSWFWFQLCITVFIFVVVIFFRKLFAEQVFDLENERLLWIAAGSYLFGVLPSITPNWFRMRRKAKQTVAYTISLSLITITLTIYFVLVKEYKVKGIFLALLIANAVMSLVSLILLKSWLFPKYFKADRLKEMLKYALPLVPTVVAFWVLNSSASFVIEYFSGKHELGIFQIGMSIASGITLLITAFRMAFPPFAFSIYKKEGAKRLFASILTAYSLVFVSVALFLSLFALELLKLFTQPSYYQAASVAGLLFFNNIVYGYSYIVGLGNGIMKDNKPIAKAVFIAALITASFFVVAIPNLGVEGAALSMLLGYLVVPILVYRDAQKKWHIPFKAKLSLLIFLGGISAFLISLSFKGLDYGYYILIRLLIFLIYLSFLYLLIRKFDRESFNKVLILVLNRIKKLLKKST
ncbi:MAG: oligosaccharide flippase family protein [Vicingaceae bacterium]